MPKVCYCLYVCMFSCWRPSVSGDSGTLCHASESGWVTVYSVFCGSVAQFQIGKLCCSCCRWMPYLVVRAGQSCPLLSALCPLFPLLLPELLPELLSQLSSANVSHPAGYYIHFNKHVCRNSVNDKRRLRYNSLFYSCRTFSQIAATCYFPTFIIISVWCLHLYGVNDHMSG